MKKLPLLFLLTLLFTDCKKEEEAPYHNFEVDFYLGHPDFEVQEATFETITEQVLVKEAHLEGATFETVTEQILVKGVYTLHQVVDSQSIYLVTNAETNTISKIACYEFLTPSEFIEIEVPAIYATRTFQRVVAQGTGAEVPATYEIRSYELLLTDGTIVDRSTERAFQRYTFRIPLEMTIEEYLIDQMAQQSIQNCMEGIAYRIP